MVETLGGDFEKRPHIKVACIVDQNIDDAGHRHHALHHVVNGILPRNIELNGEGGFTYRFGCGPTIVQVKISHHNDRASNPAGATGDDSHLAFQLWFFHRCVLKR